MPTILSPIEWGAIVNYDDWDDPFTPDDGVALHHGGGGDYAAHNPPYYRSKEVQQLQQWEGYHIYGKGWRGLAYGWAVGQTGIIYRVRGWNSYGAHRGDLDGDGIANNEEIIPILFIGSGSRVRLSQAAQDSIEWLRRNVIEEKSPQAIRLYGHQELGGTVTSCPGQYGMEYVRTHRLLPEEEDMPSAHEIAQAVWAARPGGEENPSAWQMLIRAKANTDATLIRLATIESLAELTTDEIELLANAAVDELNRRLALS